ncbi:hypothetical protein K438DRAFT_1776141 [Mycena galopus ATCC 62051]|nr:hypothetical protein K438DRAFT_1776141 [Mycena galopus ATCC 62051]
MISAAYCAEEQTLEGLAVIQKNDNPEWILGRVRAEGTSTHCVWFPPADPLAPTQRWIGKVGIVRFAVVASVPDNLFSLIRESSVKGLERFALVQVCRAFAEVSQGVSANPDTAAWQLGKAGQNLGIPGLRFSSCAMLVYGGFISSFSSMGKIFLHSGVGLKHPDYPDKIAVYHTPRLMR